MTAAVFHLKIEIFVASENTNKNYILAYFLYFFGVLLSLWGLFKLRWLQFWWCEANLLLQSFLKLFRNTSYDIIVPVHDVTNEILSRDSNIDVFLWYFRNFLEQLVRKTSANDWVKHWFSEFAIIFINFCNIFDKFSNIATFLCSFNKKRKNRTLSWQYLKYWREEWSNVKTI